MAPVRRRVPFPFPRRALRVLLLALVAMSLAGVTWAQAPVTLSRNLFFADADRPTESLGAGAGLNLGAERLDVGAVSRLRLTSPSPNISAVLRFRPQAGPAEGWLLTVVITTEKADRDFYYLSQGQLAQQDHLVPQTSYRADGIETDLTAQDEQGRSRRVGEIVLQDDGQAEVRVALDGETLQVTLVPPENGGRLIPPRFAGGQGPPLRFLDYRLMGGGHTDNGFGEIWPTDFLVLRGSYFTNNSETRGVGSIAFTRQAWRSERYSLWLEGGAVIAQRRNEKTQETQPAHAGLEAGVTGNWRYHNWGASLHLSSAAGPLLTQLFAGWQFSKSWGAVLSYQLLKQSGGYGLGLSANW